MLRHALGYASRSWPVLPVVAGAKVPITEHGFKDASTDPDQLRQWWHEHPDANIGIATGVASGLVVVDIDTEAGAETWEGLQRQHGAIDTLTAATGRGRHYFFHHRGELKSRPAFYDGIDIKASGGYVVVAPSKHPSGSRYEWVSDTDIAPLPKWLVDALETKASQPRRNGGRSLHVVGQTSQYGRAAIDEEVNAVAATGEGERNNRLNTAAYNIGQLVGGGEVAESDAEEELERAGVASGLSDREVIRTVASGLTSGKRNPRSAPAAVRRARSEPVVDSPPVVPEHLVRKGRGDKAVEFGIEQLAADHRVFERGRELVQVIDWSKGRSNVERAEGAPVISAISNARLWTLLSQICVWQRWDVRGRTEVPIDPPKQVVTSIHKSGYWPGVRHLQGVTTVPILRRDGSVVTAPGYDTETELFYASCGLQPAMPHAPSRRDAIAAKGLLEEVIIDFPFGDMKHRDGWIAASLTPLARALCDCVPMFAFDSTTPGTGKTLLADVIGMITGGRSPARTAYVKLDDELRKRIVSLALAGDPLVLLDNVPGGGAIGWPSLDSLLTATEINDRVLGESRNVTIANTMTWFCTGNNLAFKADAGRRCLRIRLEADCEHPENRTGFAHDPIKPWVLANRAELLGAGLTILSAFLRSGAVGDLQPVGSFEQWTAIVAAAVVWAGGEDVTDLFAARDAFIDPAALAHIQLMEAWLAADDGQGMTCADAIKVMGDNDHFADAVNEVCGGRKQPTSSLLGYRMRALKGRWRALSNGALARFARAGKSQKIVRWRVETDTEEECQNTQMDL